MKSRMMYAAVALLLGVALPTSVPASVIAYWYFDDDGHAAGDPTVHNTTLFHDGASGHGTHTGKAIGYNSVNDKYISTVINGQPTLATAHQSNRFDVANSHTLPTANSANAFTFEAFIRVPTNNFTGSSIFEHRDATTVDGVRGGGPELLYEGYPMQLRLTYTDGTQSVVTGSKPVRDGNWHHVAAVWDPTAQTYSLYVDYLFDVAISSVTKSWLVTNTTADIEMSVAGFNFTGFNGLYFYGDIDSVRVSDAALTPAQFQTQVIPEPGTVSIGLGAGVLLYCAWRRRASQ